MELDSKQRVFILYLAKVLKCDESKIDDKIQNLPQNTLNQLVESFNQIYQQEMNETVMARLGAKLNYIKKLNNKCPDGYKVEKYEQGGKTCIRCIENNSGALPVSAHKKGNKVISEIKSEIEGKRKVQKNCSGNKVKACGGSKLKGCNGTKIANAIKKHLRGGVVKARGN